MTTRMGWAVAVALFALPVAHAQPSQMKHPAPATASAAATPTAEATEVVWLRQRVEQLEAQLAAGGGRCIPDKKARMKGNKDSAMPAAPAADPMGQGKPPMPPMPMGDHKMGGEM